MATVQRKLIMQDFTFWILKIVGKCVIEVWQYPFAYAYSVARARYPQPAIYNVLVIYRSRFCFLELCAAILIHWTDTKMLKFGTRWSMPISKISWRKVIPTVCSTLWAPRNSGEISFQSDDCLHLWLVSRSRCSSWSLSDVSVMRCRKLRTTDVTSFFNCDNLFNSVWRSVCLGVGIRAALRQIKVCSSSMPSIIALRPIVRCLTWRLHGAICRNINQTYESQFPGHRGR